MTTITDMNSLVRTYMHNLYAEQIQSFQHLKKNQRHKIETKCAKIETLVNELADGYQHQNRVRGRAVEILKNEGVAIGVPTIVGGLVGLIGGDGPAVQAAMEGAAHGATLTSLIRVICHAGKYFTNQIHKKIVNSQANKEGMETLEKLGIDMSRTQDMPLLMDHMRKDAPTKSKKTVLEILNVYGNEYPFGCMQQFQILRSPFTGIVKYGAVALFINLLSPQNIFNLGLSTSVAGFGNLARRFAERKSGERGYVHNQNMLDPYVKESNDNQRNQIIGGLVTRWYGKPNVIRKSPEKEPPLVIYLKQILPKK